VRGNGIVPQATPRVACRIGSMPASNSVVSSGRGSNRSARENPARSSQG